MTRRPKSAADVVGDLAAKEQANVRTALQFLRVRGGGVDKLGPVLGFKLRPPHHIMERRRRSARGQVPAAWHMPTLRQKRASCGLSGH